MTDEKIAAFVKVLRALAIITPGELTVQAEPAIQHLKELREY